MKSENKIGEITFPLVLTRLHTQKSPSKSYNPWRKF